MPSAGLSADFSQNFAVRTEKSDDNPEIEKRANLQAAQAELARCVTALLPTTDAVYPDVLTEAAAGLAEPYDFVAITEYLANKAAENRTAYNEVIAPYENVETLEKNFEQSKSTHRTMMERRDQAMHAVCVLHDALRPVTYHNQEYPDLKITPETEASFKEFKLNKFLDFSWLDARSALEYYTPARGSLANDLLAKVDADREAEKAGAEFQTSETTGKAVQRDWERVAELDSTYTGPAVILDALRAVTAKCLVADADFARKLVGNYDADRLDAAAAAAGKVRSLMASNDDLPRQSAGASRFMSPTLS